MENNRWRLFWAAKIISIVIILVIGLIWVINIKQVWQSMNKQEGSSSQEEWQSFRAEMDRSLDQIKNNLNRIVSSTTTPAVSENNNTQQEVASEILKETLEKIDLSPPSLDSRPSTSSCPAWINCMPTMDSPPRDCSVPPGCEDITQIAY